MTIYDELRNGNFNPDFLDDYKDAEEDLDPNISEIFGRQLKTTMFFDEDHAYDISTRFSITGLLDFVGSTLVMWIFVNLSRRVHCNAKRC